MKKRIIIIIAAAALLLGGAAGAAVGVTAEKRSLGKELSGVRAELTELRAEQDAKDSERLNVGYWQVQYGEVAAMSGVKLYPYPNTDKALCDIPENSVMKVLYEAEKDSVRWLFVERETDEGQKDIVGWVKKEYTRPGEGLLGVGARVKVKAGTKVWTAWEIEDIVAAEAEITTGEATGNVRFEENGYVYVTRPGQESVWVKTSDVELVGRL